MSSIGSIFYTDFMLTSAYNSVLFLIKKIRFSACISVLEKEPANQVLLITSNQEKLNNFESPFQGKKS